MDLNITWCDFWKIYIIGQLLMHAAIAAAFGVIAAITPLLRFLDKVIR